MMMAKYTHTQAVSRAAAFYRANPHRFAKDFLHIDGLRWFQKIILFWMNLSAAFCTIASRGIGKSFLIAIYCCIRCVLYPGTKICICSGTRGQAILILEKIKTEILPRSPELKAELDGDIKISSTEAIANFLNVSFIKVVTASDSARGNRANVLVLDEIRMIDKDTIDTVLTKFLTSSRQPGYLSKPQYKHLKERERNRQVYLSSAFFKDHWSYNKVLSFVKNMLDEKLSWFICAFPYQLALKEGLFNKDDILDQMLDEDFSEIKWSMEMLAMFYGDSDNAFFEFETISKNRKIKYPMLPDSISSKLTNPKNLKIAQKQSGEIRILSADIALMQSKKNKNDATAIFINQLIPNKNGRFINNIVYTEANEGLNTMDQALKIRQLFDEFQCDHLVIDAKGVGMGVCDALVRDIIDTDSGEIYPALSCCNNPEWAARCQNPNAPKVIWAINANPKFNSDCAVMLREAFKAGKIRLLQTEFDADKILAEIKGFNKLDAQTKMAFKLPYIETTLLINELINLNHEESSGYVKISEKNGMRKDRYSSLSYNYWVACQLETKLGRRSANTSDDLSFVFRAPKIK